MTSSNCNSYTGNRNSGSRNQNSDGEEPEQSHEKLELSRKPDKVDEQRQSGKLTKIDHDNEDDDHQDRNQECGISVSQQHDSTSILAANRLTSLFAHVDKGKS